MIAIVLTATTIPMHHAELCPCGSGQPFSICCQPIINGDLAPNPEALMRSRYSAYALGHWHYLRQSWHPDSRPSAVRPSDNDWLSLNIIRADNDTVEFIAAFRQAGKTMALHEISRFAKDNGHWRYLDGQCDISETATTAPVAVT